MASSFLRGSEVRQPTQDFRLGGDGRRPIDDARQTFEREPSALAHSSALHQDRLDIRLLGAQIGILVRSWQRTALASFDWTESGCASKFVPLLPAPQQFPPTARSRRDRWGSLVWYAAFPKIPGPSDHSVRALLLLSKSKSFLVVCSGPAFSSARSTAGASKLGFSFMASSQRLRRREMPLLLWICRIASGLWDREVSPPPPGTAVSCWKPRRGKSLSSMCKAAPLCNRSWTILSTPLLPRWSNFGRRLRQSSSTCMPRPPARKLPWGGFSTAKFRRSLAHTPTSRRPTSGSSRGRSFSL
jgi:hypothetical protein